jgi:hypothetical protein
MARSQRVLPSLHLSTLVRKGVSMQTKRTLSRSTLTVQDMTVASALQPSLPSMNTPRCDLRPTPGTALQPTKRRERFSCPGVHRLTVLWSLCDDNIAQIRTDVKVFPSADGAPFIPMFERQGPSGARKGKKAVFLKTTNYRQVGWYLSCTERG